MLRAMLSDKLRPVIDPATAAIGRGLSRLGFTPNALTSVGLIATLGCAVLLGRGELLIGGLALIPAALIDIFDGALARATNRVSRWGGFYDSLCDRVGDSALLAAVAWFAVGDEALLAGALAALVLGGLVPYARAKGEALGVTVASGPGERAERIIILIVGAVLGVTTLTIAVWVIAALSLWTSIARAASIRRQTR